MTSLLLTLLAFSLPIWAKTQQPLGNGQQPNIVFILTDDQDLHMDSLKYMPLLKKHIIDHGTSFTRHYCTNALCCPSRVSLWTGKAAHNTNVTDVNPPYGGYPKFISQGFNEAYLPIWLQSAGYQTYYVGKLFNAQTIDNYASPHAAGWTGSDFLLDPYTYEYLNATFQRNHDKPISYEGEYITDVLAQKAYTFLSDALAKRHTPFFLTIAPTAPHSNVQIHSRLIDGNFSEKSATQSPPIPAKRHKHLFHDVVVPRTENFNPPRSSSVSWIATLPQQNATNVAFNDEFYRNRLRALQAVDEIVEGVVSRLATAGVLEETYIFFSTDNGYHIGQHRLQPGKQCAFEEDINVPLVVRGPGVSRREVGVVTTHTDLAPTFLGLAGVEGREGFDGVAIPLRGEEGGRQEHVNIEMWGIVMSEGKYGSELYRNHSYKALRVVGEWDLLYTVWCTGEHELYDLKRDPFELENLYTTNEDAVFAEGNFTGGVDVFPSGMVIDSRNVSSGVYTVKLLDRLDALTMVLKTCTGRACTHPWEVLHPGGRVASLRQALAGEFDAFYKLQRRRVRFAACEKGYFWDNEGPWEIEPYLLD